MLSQSLTNPTLMAQIAMAVKDVPYEDIVFVQYPTVYAQGTGGSSRVLPVTDAADALFAALRANQPITLTGDASQGYGVEVTGEAAKPLPPLQRLRMPRPLLARLRQLRRPPRSASRCRTTSRAAPPRRSPARSRSADRFVRSRRSGYDCWAHPCGFGRWMPGDVA